MKAVIVPNEIGDAIERELNRFLKEHPQFEEKREDMRQCLLAVFDEYGVIAELTLKKEAKQ